MEFMIFLLGVCGIALICTLVCWREVVRTRNRKLEQRRGEQLMLAVLQMSPDARTATARTTDGVLARIA